MERRKELHEIIQIRMIIKRQKVSNSLTLVISSNIVSNRCKSVQVTKCVYYAGLPRLYIDAITPYTKTRSVTT